MQVLHSRPVPGRSHSVVLFIGTDGIIRFVHVNKDYKVRLEPAKILDAVKNNPVN